MRFLRLSPLSLAVKCQLMFGSAVALTLIIALILPYIWMRQLVKTDFLDTERAKSETLLYRQHFKLKDSSQTALATLDVTGRTLDPNDKQIRWIRFAKNGELPPEQSEQLTSEQIKVIESLKADDGRLDTISFEETNGVPYSNYTRIVRANDNCISCHNEQDPTATFSPNELIGAVITKSPAAEIGKMYLLNRVWVSVAGLIAGLGAIIAFYWISQRVILRPIRRLRAMVNNVAEGNLNIRSTIKTGDEYEKLAIAFNNMLDGLQEAQEKLRQANKQLDAKIAELSDRNIELFKANKLKSEFLANISHEFRTPLNSILGFAQVLRDKPALMTRDKGRRYTENIITGGNRLLNMINDLLDLAKTKAGKIELHIEETSLPQLIDSAVSSFSLETKRKKIKVKVSVKSNLPPLITDAGKVQQIIYNFLSNAVKFTPERGRIEIRAALKTDEKTLRIEVSDTGCGIAEQDKEKIFEKFGTADGTLTRQSTGSGLGLAISAELAAMLAGNMCVDSELGKGSTFWLDIPTTLTKEKSDSTEKKEINPL
ncbi:MAG: HAMP domain-containing protein [Sedimentisphaerales bacterium]|nr:HAMP domain-containing protein [Sedimentisphaerales bacterium]